MPLSFRKRVFGVVKKIPKGSVLTYKEVAKRAGSPKAFRAVGSILKANFDPTISCHRVIKSDLPAPRPEVYYVYAILCGNGAIYIGQTQNLQARRIYNGALFY
jgi:O-6-methylguanine DNA methyltransferase